MADEIDIQHSQPRAAQKLVINGTEIDPILFKHEEFEAVAERYFVEDDIEQKRVLLVEFLRLLLYPIRLNQKDTDIYKFQHTANLLTVLSTSLLDLNMGRTRPIMKAAKKEMSRNAYNGIVSRDIASAILCVDKLVESKTFPTATQAIRYVTSVLGWKSTNKLTSLRDKVRSGNSHFEISANYKALHAEFKGITFGKKAAAQLLFFAKVSLNDYDKP